MILFTVNLLLWQIARHAWEANVNAFTIFAVPSLLCLIQEMLGKQILTLFTVILHIELISEEIWEVHFDAIYCDPAKHISTLFTVIPDLWLILEQGWEVHFGAMYFHTKTTGNRSSNSRIQQRESSCLQFPLHRENCWGLLILLLPACKKTP